MVYNGRDTSIALNNWGKSISFGEWASEKLEQMQPIAELFDRAHGGNNYANALARQQEKVRTRMPHRLPRSWKNWNPVSKPSSSSP